jgi:hypothetical protein
MRRVRPLFDRPNCSHRPISDILGLEIVALKPPVRPK